MNYKTKVKYAKDVADQLQNQKSIASIKSALKTEGLYEPDINKIIVSARNILGEKYQPKIGEYLLADKEIHGAEEFSLLDAEIIDTLIAKESQNLAVKEKKKITKLMREGRPADEVFEQTDTRFLSADKAENHINRLQEIKTNNSGSGRMVSILGGLGLIVLTGILLVTLYRIFFVLPVLGLVMIGKGFMTEKME